jgi:cytochrome c-type biogenesis protein
MDFDVTLAGALLAGVLSFVSPCILPLVPPYLGFLGGLTFEQLAEDEGDRAVARRVVIAALAFVLGFATVFVILGATASAISRVVATYSGWLAQIAGLVIIGFGLHFLGLLRLSFVDRELRWHPERRPPGLIGAYVIGLAFAFGWTPCIGPVLAAILTVAATQEDAVRGAVLLGAYALGIGLPFLAAALFIRPFLGVLRRLKPQMRRIEQALGVLLILTGLLISAGAFEEIGYWLLRAFPALGRLG